MKEVIGVTFDGKSKIYYFSPNQRKIKKNINVIVETERGLQFGQVVLENFEVSEDKLTSPLKNIVRIASRDDYRKHRRNMKDANYALKKCRYLVDELEMKMKVLDASFTFDRSQLAFRFLADTRIDFRELAKRIASIYHTRIELRQVGVRDKAKEIGGIGSCGHELCCTRFLKEFDSVTINMAKDQGIALNPNKINGLCGRLLCCLKYEDECYKECKKLLPTIGSTYKTSQGEGKVVSVDVLTNMVTVEVPEVGWIKEKVESYGSRS